MSLTAGGGRSTRRSIEVDDYEKKARELADHCRYCGKEGLKCQADFERQIEEIALALREAEERGMHLLCSHGKR